MRKVKLIVYLMFTSMLLTAQDAKKIVATANEKQQGEISSESVMTMEVIRPTWSRKVTFKSWSKGTKYSMVLITAPAKEKGQTFLKRDREMWNWNPRINRMIKLPPSMLSQGWMGSDFTNDDLLNQASIVVDYNHKIEGEENLVERACYKIELTPKEDAPVVWGKIIMWISKADFMILKTEYYDEDDYLVKSEIAKDIKTMDGRLIPVHFELIPAEEEDQKTVVILEQVKFDKPITDNFFSQQNMKKLR